MSARIYCTLPWFAMQLHPEGTYSSCCHIHLKGHRPPSSVKELMALWNSKDLIELRKNLLNSTVKNTPCENCYNRLFTTDHDMLGMVRHLPMYSLHGKEFEVYYKASNEAYIRGVAELESPPLELYIYTSEQCNLKCIMCTQNKNFREFPTKNITPLVEELGWERIDRFGWVGGEPFLTRDALDLLEITSSQDTKGTCIYITTNGTLIDKHIHKLDKINNLYLTISIDGVGDIYEKVRGKSNWKRLSRNLELLKEHKRRHPNWKININSVVMNSTYSNLKDMIDLAHSIGATLFFSPINGGHPKEDIFFNPNLINSFSTFGRDIDEAVEYANELKMFRAQDSLEKIRVFMNHRKQYARTHPIRSWMGNMNMLLSWNYFQHRQRGWIHTDLRKAKRE